MPTHFSDPNLDPKKKDAKNTVADQTSREGGDDALADIRPTDPKADEQVIVNEQENNRIVNRPSQTELGRNGDDIVNN